MTPDTLPPPGSRRLYQTVKDLSAALGEPPRITQLAKAMGIDALSARKGVDALVRQGFVEWRTGGPVVAVGP